MARYKTIKWNPPGFSHSLGPERKALTTPPQKLLQNHTWISVRSKLHAVETQHHFHPFTSLPTIQTKTAILRSKDLLMLHWNKTFFINDRPRPLLPCGDCAAGVPTGDCATAIPNTYGPRRLGLPSGFTQMRHWTKTFFIDDRPAPQIEIFISQPKKFCISPPPQKTSLTDTKSPYHNKRKILFTASNTLSGPTKKDTWTSQGSSTWPRSAHVAAVVGLHRCPPLRRRRTAVGIWHLEDAHPRQRNAWHPPLKHFHPVRSWPRPNAPMCIAWQLSKTPWTSSASHAPMPGGPFPCVSMCRMPLPRNWGQLPTWARQVAGTHLHLPDLLPDHCSSSQTWLEGLSHSRCCQTLLLAQQSHIPAPLFPTSSMPTHERWAVCLSLDHTLHLHRGKVLENTFANTRDCTYSRAHCPCGPPAPLSCSLPPNHCLQQCPSHAPTCPTLPASPLKTYSLPGDENCPPPSQIPFLALPLAVDPSTTSAWQQTPWNNAPHPSHRSPLRPPHSGMPASPPHQMDLPPLLRLWVRLPPPPPLPLRPLSNSLCHPLSCPQVHSISPALPLPLLRLSPVRARPRNSSLPLQIVCRPLPHSLANADTPHCVTPKSEQPPCRHHVVSRPILRDPGPHKTKHGDNPTL